MRVRRPAISARTFPLPHSRTLTPPHFRMPGPFLLRLLVSAIVLQDIVWVLVMRSNRDSWPEWTAIVAIGLAFCQTGLAALLVLATGPGWWKHVGVAALFTVLAAWLGQRATLGIPMTWLGIMVLDLAIVAGPLIVARLAGMRVVPQGRAEEPSAATRQYSILGLLILMTLTAVLLSIARALAPWVEIGQLAVFAISLGAIPWICGPLALSSLSWPWPILAAAIVCPLAGLAIAQTDFPPNHPAQLIAMCCVQGGLTVAACAVVRLAGYVLVWPGRDLGLGARVVGLKVEARELALQASLGVNAA